MSDRDDDGHIKGTPPVLYVVATNKQGKPSTRTIIWWRPGAYRAEQSPPRRECEIDKSEPGDQASSKPPRLRGHPCVPSHARPRHPRQRTRAATGPCSRGSTSLRRQSELLSPP